MEKIIKDLDIYISDGNYSSKYPRSEEFVEEGIPFIRGNNMIDGDITDDEMYHITPEKHAILLKGHVKAGDVLITTRGNIGQVAIVPERHEDSNINAQIVLLRTNPDSLYNRYLLWALQSQKANEQYLALQTGTALKQLPVGKLERLSIKVTDIEQQHEIADILDKTYEIIKSRKNELMMLDDLIKARFVELFGSIHDGKFEMKTLPEIVSENKNSIKRGPFGGALKKDDFVEEGYLVYEQRHAIHNDFEYAKYYITQEKYEDMIGFKVVPGDLIISCSGVTLGRIAEVPEGAKEGIINQALLKISLNSDVMMNTFFVQQFRGDEIQEVLFGFSRGSGIPNMPSMSEVKSVKFICPPLELQKQYCDFVKQVDKSKVVA